MPLYAAHFPGLIYNCKDSVYDLTPLPGSIIRGGKIFACNKQLVTAPPGHNTHGTLAVALKLSASPNEHTYYKSIERLKNLICLSYTAMPQEHKWQEVETTVHSTVNNNLATHFYNPEVRFGGQLDWDLPLRVAAYSQNIAGLSEGSQSKFWQALQTFCFARQIAHLPNPQFKYTLYMTLHLASINQLADEPKSLHTPPVHLVCPECNERSGLIHSTSHLTEIKNLIDRLVPAEHSERYKTFIDGLFHRVRSSYIHRGEFAGSEDIGGFIALFGNNVELPENDINLMILNRSLLEQFIVQN
jgi:hypothetical protein